MTGNDPINLRSCGLTVALSEMTQSKENSSLRSECVTKLRFGDFVALKPIVFSTTFCEKSKKSQPLRMTTRH